jgi:hypothetical protein
MLTAFSVLEVVEKIHNNKTGTKHNSQDINYHAECFHSTSRFEWRE